jgi:Derlin-2/3
MALIHTWAQDNRGRPVRLYMLNMKAEWFPLALLVISLVVDGWYSFLLGATGIFASHLYDFITRLWPMFGGGRNFIFTPAFVHRLFGTNSSNRQVFGGNSSSSSQPQTAASASRSAWSTRGAGRRLGGN